MDLDGLCVCKRERWIWMDCVCVCVRERGGFGWIVCVCVRERLCVDVKLSAWLALYVFVTFMFVDC